jgi:hypothetical protein
MAGEREFKVFGNKANLLYVDETGLDEGLSRAYGYGFRGQRVMGEGEKSGKRFVRRSSIIARLCLGKPMAPWVYEGYCDTEVVLTWVRHVLVPDWKPGMTVVMEIMQVFTSIR